MKENDEPGGTRPAAKTVKIREAAAIIGVSQNSVRRLIQREKLRSIRVLRHHLICVEEIERFLKGN